MPGKILFLNAAVFPCLSTGAWPVLSCLPGQLSINFREADHYNRQLFSLDKLRGGWDLLH